VAREKYIGLGDPPSGDADRAVFRAVLRRRRRLHPIADQPRPGHHVSDGQRHVSQPGAAPTEMETQIAQKIEGSISSIGNVRNITTYIVEGSVNIDVQFQIGTPVDRAVTDVRDAVAKVRNDLPQGISSRRCSAELQRSVRVLRGHDDRACRPRQLSWFVDNTVTKRLLAVPGVAQVSRSGGVSREIRVELDPARMQALGITAVRSQRTAAGAQPRCAGGRAQLGGGEQAIRVLGGAKSAAALGDSQIIVHGGKSVRLREIADVRDGIEEVRTIARLNGRPATTFGVSRRSAPPMSAVAQGRRRGAQEDHGRESRRQQPDDDLLHRAAYRADLPFLDQRADRGLDARGRRGLVLPAQLARDRDFGARDSLVGDPDLRVHGPHGLHAQPDHAARTVAGGRRARRRRDRRDREHRAPHAHGQERLQAAWMPPTRSASRSWRPRSRSSRCFCR
jgi:hypothetical protein